MPALVPKRQHYVPQFYLRRFSNDGKSIAMFNLSAMKLIERAAIDENAQEFYFYGRDGDMESTLRQAEGNAAPLLKKIVDEQWLPERWTQDHMELLFYSVLQHGRTLSVVTQFDHAMSQMRNQLGESADRLGIPEVEKSDAEGRGREIVRHWSRVIPMGLDLHFKLVHIDSGGELITSDNPVVFYNRYLENSGEEGSACGITIKGLLLFFPIGPRDCLVFYDASVYKVGKSGSNVVMINGLRDVMQLNRLQIANALQNIYFLDTTVDVEEIKSALRHRRNELADVKVVQQNSSGVLRRTSRIDVRIGLELSFLGVTKRASEERRRYYAQKMRPASWLRIPPRVREMYDSRLEDGTGDINELIRIMRENSRD